MPRPFLFAATIIIGLSNGIIQETRAVELTGQIIEGGLVLGQAETGSTVTLDGEPVKVAPDGRFMIGFHREAPETATLKIISPDGDTEETTLNIEQRTYDIQRIDGLPPKKVTPPQSFYDRLKRERGMVGTARKQDAGHLYWADGFVWPVKGRISGIYGSQRILNSKPRQPHYGIDIAAPKGTPIGAPGAGTVVLAESDFYYEGGIVIIDHGYGLMSTLFHMASVDVETGQQIAQGGRIGTVGATGRATGPHVDWRLNWHKARLDPALLVPPMP